MRINKYLCATGLCSRKAADDFVSRGEVSINGRVASVGDQVSRDDSVTLKGAIVKLLGVDDVIVIAFNKPRGVVCTASAQTENNIVAFVSHPSRVYPVGRLDKESEGLIFLTNKSGLVDNINQSGNRHEKEYRVTVNKPITESFLEGMRHGVPILGQTTQACSLAFESEYVFRIVLTQGLNRQIRRMCSHFGFRVVNLQRVRIMHVHIDGLAPGEWRNLTTEELNPLLSLAVDENSV
ncbi:MAG: pseudouridine synthase [Granulosicoccus sp.]